jgi:dTDP-4-dehydrorhamnose 3,5-epimerase
VIEGVKVKRLVRHVDDRGYLMEILRDDDDLFVKFGQVYVSVHSPGVVTAWHAHHKQYDHFCVVKGNAKIGVYDDREGSPTRGQAMAIVAGEWNPVLVQVPPMVWHGYVALGNEPAYIINLPSEHYDAQQPDELRRDPFDPTIPFEWDVRAR